MRRKKGLGIGGGVILAAFSVLLSGPVSARAAEGDLKIDEKSFPDAVFCSYVSEKFDTDQDGFLSDAEIEAVTAIDVTEKDIASMEGIAYFPNLKTLDCKWTEVKDLDVSKNTALEVLSCYETDMESLNIGSNPNLKKLVCGANNLTELDVSGSPNLELLACEWSELTSLDLSQNTALNYLDCEHNNLKELDLGKNTAIKTLNCSWNNLTNLDLSNNTALEELECIGIELTSLDLQHNEALIFLNCDACELTALDASNLPNLNELRCSENKIQTLDISNTPELETLDCQSNELTKLDLRDNKSLKQLYCQTNELSELDLSENTALVELNCSENSLANLDVSKNPGLIHAMEVGYVRAFFQTIEYNTEEKESVMHMLKADKTTKILGTDYLDIGESTLSLAENEYTFCHEDFEPNPTVLYQGNTLTCGTDYELDYMENYFPGTATVLVRGIGNYRGANIITFTIGERNIADAEMTKVSARVYKGTELIPAVTLTVDGEVLYKNFDYTIAYLQNKNVGTATIKITGKGNYKGVLKKTFRVLPKGTSLKKVTAGKGSFTATWTPVKEKMSTSYITGYQIQYSTSKTFATNKKVRSVVGYARTGAAVKDLKKGTYYVRIRTYKKVNGVNYFAPWSESTKVVVKQ